MHDQQARHLDANNTYMIMKIIIIIIIIMIIIIIIITSKALRRKYFVTACGIPDQLIHTTALSSTALHL